MLVIAALAFGALVSALAMTLVLKSPEKSETKGVSASSPKAVPDAINLQAQQASQSAMPEQSSPPGIQIAQEPDPKTTTSAPAGAWGSASVYKFGRVPGGEYPDSCAFSRTDSQGETIIDRSQLDYWACRDQGGNSTDGFSVEWVDGKRTKYTFAPGGSGYMVGTDGREYPINWSNEHKNGSKVIVISHENGSVSWIPGHVN